MRLNRAAASFLCAGALIAASTPPVHADPADPVVPLPQWAAELNGQTEPAAYFVRLRTTPAVQRISLASADQDPTTRLAIEAEVAADVNVDAQEILTEIPEADLLYTTSNGVSGVALYTSGESLTALADRPDVTSVTRIPVLYPSTSTTDVVTEAFNTWGQNTGRDVTIAVIDSGIDFTHKDFGGDGNAAQYRDPAARAAAPAADDFPNQVIVGGWDFAGEDYTGGPGAQEDPNPMDVPTDWCTAPAHLQRVDGHGTHVAGSAAGRGVTESGETFTGDYTSLKPKDLARMKVGPGVAPGAQIVALRIFGCAGGTTLMYKAFDWLLSSDDQGQPRITDVINLSLGSEYGAHDEDITDEYIKRLTERGALVVAAAGNDGNLPEVISYPASDRQVLAVANSHADVWMEEADDLSQVQPQSHNNQINIHSSRGLHGSHGVIKPDISAPGQWISSAGVGTGDQAKVATGTSMSSPAVAGAAALVAEARPNFSPLELKAALMNTATTDIVFPSGAPQTPIRAGSGLLNARDAVDTDVLVYATSDPDLVSLTFGVVDVPAAGWEQTQEVTVRNVGDSPASFALSYAPALDMPGVDFAIEPTQVEVAAGQSTTVRVTARVTDQAALRRVADESEGYDFVAQEAGRLVLSSDTQTLRLPLHVAPRPVAAQQVPATAVVPQLATATDLEASEVPLPVSGEGFAGLAESERFNSYAFTTKLVAELPRGNDDKNIQTDWLRAMYLRRIGIATNLDDVAQTSPEDAHIFLALETWDAWTRLGTERATFHVRFSRKDSNATGEVHIASVETQGHETNLHIVNRGTAKTTDQVPLLGLDYDQDNALFDSRVIGLEVPLKALGYSMQDIRDKNIEFEYQVTAATNAAPYRPGLGDWNIGSRSPELYFSAQEARVLPPANADAAQFVMRAGPDVNLTPRVAGPAEQVKAMRLLTIFTRNTDDKLSAITTLHAPASIATPTPTVAPSPTPTPTLTATPSPIPTGTPHPTPAVTRIAGPNRFGTAAELYAARADWGSAVVLASGDNFADALAATPLAAALDAPLLLTNREQLPTDTLTALQRARRLGADNVYVAGGMGTISHRVVAQLEDLGFTVERLHGSSRYETAHALAGKTRQVLASQGLLVGHVVLVDGTNFADALSAGPVAAAHHGVILLTDGTTLRHDTKRMAASIQSPKVAIGGAAARASGALADNGVVGPNRYATATLAAEQYLPTAPGVVLTSGLSFPDALAGGAFAAKHDAALLLVTTNQLPAPVAQYLQRKQPQQVWITGGVSTVNATVEQATRHALHR